MCTRNISEPKNSGEGSGVSPSIIDVSPIDVFRKMGLETEEQRKRFLFKDLFDSAREEGDTSFWITLDGTTRAEGAGAL